MVRLGAHLTGCVHKCIGLGLQFSAAPLLDFSRPVGQAGKEGIHLLANLGSGAEAEIGRHVFADPVPDGFVRVEVWAVAWQGNQAQLEVRRGQVLAHLWPMMHRSVVPDHDQPLNMLLTQLLQKGDRGCRRGVAQDDHGFYLASLQTDSRIVGDFLAQPGASRVDQRRFATQHPLGAQFDICAEMRFVHEVDLGTLRLGFCPQDHVGCDKGSTFLGVGFEQSFLGSLEDKSEPVQVVQTTTAAELLAADIDHQHGVVPKGEYVTLRVRDTGCGIPAKLVAQIFEPYFSTKDAAKGSGLGLSMVEGIIEQHRGSIVCESKEAEGTTFAIFLPLARGPALADRESEEFLDADAPLPATKTILIVEDEVGVRTVTKRLLQREGYTVLAAADADEALHISEHFRGPIHLLFTDVIMPGTNGVELAKILAERRPDMKVLFTSGYTDSVVIRQGLEAATLELLHKPYSSQELAAKVRTVLSDRRRKAAP